MLKKKIVRRIEFIDIVKCAAIFMVVWGHTATNDELTGANPSLLYRMIYSIHMPLFFFLSGLSLSLKNYKGWKEWRYFLRKNILCVAIPYLIWTLVFCNFNFQNVGKILYGSWQALSETGTVTSLWYMACLFCTRIIVQSIIFLMHKLGHGTDRPLYCIPATCLTAVGLLLPKISTGYPWCCDIAFVATGIMLFGIAAKHSLIKLSVQKNRILFAAFIGSVALYVLSILKRSKDFAILLMCKNVYGDLLGAFASTVTGSFALIVLAQILKRMADEWIPKISLAPMIYLGQHTLGVYLLHKPMMQQLFLPILTKCCSAFFPLWLIRLIGAVITVIVATRLCQLIEYYIPEMVGIFSRDKIAGDAEKTGV